MLLLPFICIPLYSKYNMIDFIDEETPYYIWNRDFCTSQHESGYKTVFLGDSTANAAFIPEALSDSVVNLAMGGATPAECYYIMNDYLANNTAPSDVFISFYDNHLYESTNFWNRTMYSHRFTPLQNLRIIQNAKKYKDNTIFTDTCCLDYISYELYLPNKYITALTNAGFNQRRQANKDAYYLIGLRSGRYLTKQSTQEDTAPLECSEFTVSDLFDYYYRQLIDLCVTKGIRVHLIKLPLPSDTVFTENYIRQFNGYYNDLKKDYPSISVDWLRGDYDKSCFCDQIHMNSHGALRFNTELLKSHYPYAFEGKIGDAQKEAIRINIIDETSIDDIFLWCDLAGYRVTVCSNKEWGEFSYLPYEQTDDELCFRISNPDGDTLVCEKYFKHTDAAFELIDTVTDY